MSKKEFKMSKKEFKMSKNKITHNLVIGENAGCDINYDNIDGVVIIGDNIRDLNKAQDNVLFLMDRVAIGETLGGVKINLKEVLIDYIKKLKEEEKEREKEEK